MINRTIKNYFKMDELEKALEEIVRNFLLHETAVQPDKLNNKDDSEDEQVQLPENKTVTQLPDDDFVANLYQCFAERGVLREVHSLLRKRLVEILKGSFPTVITSGCTSELSLSIVRLLEDFMCCHNFLFTYSVFASEVKRSNQFNRNFTKLSFYEAENILNELGISRNSLLSRQILRKYSNNQDTSLLDCLFELSILTTGRESDKVCRDTDVIIDDESYSPLGASSKRLKYVDHQLENTVAENVSSETGIVDEKYLQLHLSMEREKEAEIKIAIQRFREEEVNKIRNEIETKMKFEFIAKEKDLLRNYDDRVAHMKSLLDREKELWSVEKARKEKEVLAQKQDLIRLMEHVKEKKLRLKEAMQKAELHQKYEPSSDSADKQAGMALFSEDNDTSPESDRKMYLMKNVQLESTVRRLQEDNLRLQKTISKQSQGYHRKLEKYSNVSTDDDLREQVRKSKKSNDDRVPLLQYTIEKQAEELETLKSQLKSEKRLFKSSPAPTVRSNEKPVPDSPFLHDTGLETFLAESKLRFAEIEKKADVMSSSLKEVFKRSNVPQGRSHADLGDSMATEGLFKIPAVPKLSSTLKQQSSFRSDSVAKPTYKSKLQTPSLEPSLKSFLLSQQEDMFTSGIEIPQSSHIKLLTDCVYKRGVVTSGEFHELSRMQFSQGEGGTKGPRGEPAASDQPVHVSSHDLSTKNTVSSSKAVRRSSESISNNYEMVSTEPTRVQQEVLLPAATPLQEPKEIQRSSEVQGSSTTKISQLPSETIISNQQMNTKVSERNIRDILPHILRDDSFDRDGVEDVVVSNKSQGDSKPQEPTGEFSTFNEKKPSVQTDSGGENAGVVTVDLNPELFPFREVNVVPTSATASSSGALIQYKVPSPDVSQHDVPFKYTKLTTTKKDKGSWGDTVVGAAISEIASNKVKKSSSSDNDISFPEVSHAEGDTSEFMVEEDFWAI